MPSLFDQVIDCSNQIHSKFLGTGTLELSSVHPTLQMNDYEFTSNRYRRAHISTIDARETNKLYLLHVTVFPHFNDPSPIYGFDIVCGPTRVSGAFHDFSASGDKDHPMCRWFANKVGGIDWNKSRDLPEWARNIFSNHMIAIGSVGTEELSEFISIGLDALDFYLSNVGADQQSGFDYHMAQNRYCYYQKQNPRTPTSLMHLGLSEQEAKDYVSRMLFPEVA